VKERITTTFSQAADAFAGCCSSDCCGDGFEGGEEESFSSGESLLKR